MDRARRAPKAGTTSTWVFEQFGDEIPYDVVTAVPGKCFALGGTMPGRGPFLLEITIEREAEETVRPDATRPRRGSMARLSFELGND